MAVVCCTTFHATLASPPDPALLSCTFQSGRLIGGIVLFKRLKKLRIWYGDGGGEEWNDVNFESTPIITSTQGDRGIVLSADFTHVIFNSGDEHSFGDCKIANNAKAPLWWFNPTLTQEWEYKSKP